MTVLYCNHCKCLINLDIQPQLQRSLNCHCHDEIQKLAVRPPGTTRTQLALLNLLAKGLLSTAQKPAVKLPNDASPWQLAIRARLLALDDSIFDDA